jgi:hypothetical protein
VLQSEGRDQTQWARPRADVNRGLRRGAWYRVIALTPGEVIVDVNRNVRIVPREGVEIVTTPPQRWSIVWRPPDAVRVPDDWGDRYALCPACRNRTPIKGHSATLRCPRCAGLFQIAWDELERSA